jgi:hypothetical protein
MSYCDTPSMAELGAREVTPHIPDEIARALRWLGTVYEDADFPDPKARPARVPYDNERRTCISVIEGYVRMIALRDEFRTIAAAPHEPGTPDMRLLCAGFADRIEGALEGRKP